VSPLELSYDIDCSPARAFEVWTTRLSTWWPRGHNATGSDDSVMVLEPRLGGRLLERTASGEEVEVGEITSWDPPHGFGYLWHIRRDRSEGTDVLLRFVPVDGRTRLEIVQTGWERLGAEGVAWRASNSAGWNALIPSYLADVRAGGPGPG
jgi:uncharacterized protein YndB with AHSA1/START domain